MTMAAHSEVETTATMTWLDSLEQTSGNDCCSACGLRCQSKSLRELSVKHYHLPKKQTKNWEEKDEKGAASKLGEELKRKSEECVIQRNAILQQLSVNDLKDILSTTNYTTSGKKPILIERINKMGKEKIDWLDQHLEVKFPHIAEKMEKKRLRPDPDVGHLFDESALDKGDGDGQDDAGDSRDYEYSPLKNSGDLDFNPCPIVHDDEPIVFEQRNGRGTLDEKKVFAESINEKQLTVKLNKLTMSIARLDEGADNSKILVEWYDKIKSIHKAIKNCVEMEYTGEDDKDTVKETFAPTKIAFKNACEELIHDPNTYPLSSLPPHIY